MVSSCAAPLRATKRSPPSSDPSPYCFSSRRSCREASL